MAWIKLSDRLDEAPKIVGISPLAELMYIHGLMYANRNLTDGFIPTQVANFRLLDGADNADELAEELVQAKLWHVAENGFEVHDYLQHQRSSEEIKVLSDARAKAGRKGGKRAPGQGKKDPSKPQAKPKQPTSNCASKPQAEKNRKEEELLTPLNPLLQQVMVEIERIAEHHSQEPPSPAAIQKCLDDFPDRDHVAVAKGFSFWQVENGGERRTNLASAFRFQLDRAKPVVKPVGDAGFFAAFDRVNGRAA